MSRYLLLTGASALHASCSTAPAGQERSSRAAQELADTLAGRVAGPSQRCIDSYRATKVHPIDDSTVIYDQGRIIYVQNPRVVAPASAAAATYWRPGNSAPRGCAKMKLPTRST